MADLMIIMGVLNLSTSRVLPYVRSNTVHVSTEGPLTGTTNADGGDSKHLSPILQPGSKLDSYQNNAKKDYRKC